MRKDYKVARRTLAEIRDTAARCRRVLGVLEHSTVRMTDLFRVLSRSEILKTGVLKLEFFNVRKGKPLAYVTYKPTTLHIDKEVWDDADLGEPYSNYILAHELGHVIMHDNSAQPFSGESSPAWSEEESSEWQADTFADEFLLTDLQIRKYITLSAIALNCGVDREVVKRRVGKRLCYAGEACTKCGNFTLVRNGTRLKCDTCGERTESA